jgi:hypothetical protein
LPKNEKSNKINSPNPIKVKLFAVLSGRFILLKKINIIEINGQKTLNTIDQKTPMYLFFANLNDKYKEIAKTVK